MEKSQSNKTWNMKDKELIPYIELGKPPLSDQAKATLFSRYSEKLTRVYAKKNISDEDAHDLVIEALLASFDQITRGDFRRNSKYKTYLEGILDNLYAGFIRRKSTQKAGKGKELSLEQIQAAGPFDPAGISPSPFQLYQNKELRETIKRLMRNAEICMKIFNWRGEGYSYKEIARKLGLQQLATEKAVKQRSYRCRKALKDKILKECPELIPQFIRRKEVLHGVF